jgi:hypothetical protein
MISRPMARRSPRGVTLVQVVVVVALISLAIGGMTYAFFGELNPLFGTADQTLTGTDKHQAEDHASHDQVTGRPATSDPNAMRNSMTQQATQNSQAAAKAKGTP